MALPDEPFFKVLVETFDGGNASGRHGRLHVRPVAGQGLDTGLYVECPRAMREDYPVNTRFFVTGKLSDREGGTQYLKCPHQWGFSIAGDAEAEAFLRSLRVPQRR